MHNDPAAQKIVRRWLGAEGLLSNIAHLNELGLALLTNIAPVVPEPLLDQMEQIFEADADGVLIGISNPSRGRLASILRSFAYEQQFFDRAATLLSEFVAAEPEGHNRDSVRQHFTELFQIYLSGTHASGEQRRAIVRALLRSSDVHEQRVGIKALGSMLKAHHFMSMADFSFGARPRDFGWHPSTRRDIADWYSNALDLAEEFAAAADPVGPEIRHLLASNFRELWTLTGQWQKLAAIARAICGHGAWIDGWIATRTTLNFNSGMPDDVKIELRSLIEDLRPRDLPTMARAYIFSEPWRALDIADSESDEVSHGEGYQRAFTRTEELGAELIQEPEAFRQILTETAVGKLGRSNAFGRGIASAAPDKLEMWSTIREALAPFPLEQRNYGVASGFLSKLSQIDNELVQQILDDAVEDDVFGPVLPMLQIATTLDSRDLRRLKRSLDAGIAQMHTYSYLTLGRVTDPLDPAELSEFVVELASKENGYSVAIDILHMRLHSERDAQKETGREMPPPLVNCAKDLLLGCDFSGSDRMDYELAELVRWGLAGEQGDATARQLCKSFADALRDYRTSAYLFDSLALALFETQPIAALDELLSESGELAALVDFRISRAAPLHAVSHGLLLQWASNDTAKFERLAASIPLFEKSDEEPGNTWSSKFVALLNAAPDKRAFLNVVTRHLHPTSWSGSLAKILEDRRRLVEEFSQVDDPVISTWAQETVRVLNQQIQYELSRERREDESFE